MAEQKDWSKWATAGELIEKQAKQRVGPETAYTVALEELEKITTVTSGSYNAAINLKDTLATKLPDEEYGRVEPMLQDVVTNTKRAVEELQGLKELIRQAADENTAATARSHRMSVIEIVVAIVEIVAAIMIARNLIG